MVALPTPAINRNRRDTSVQSLSFYICLWLSPELRELPAGVAQKRFIDACARSSSPAAFAATYFLPLIGAFALVFGAVLLLSDTASPNLPLIAGALVPAVLLTAFFLHAVIRALIARRFLQHD